MKFFIILLLSYSAAFGADVTPEDLEACTTRIEEPTKPSIERVQYDVDTHMVSIKWVTGETAFYKVIERVNVHYRQADTRFYTEYVSGDVPNLEFLKQKYMRFTRPNYERYRYDTSNGTVSFSDSKFGNTTTSLYFMICGPYMVNSDYVF